MDGCARTVVLVFWTYYAINWLLLANRIDKMMMMKN